MNSGPASTEDVRYTLKEGGEAKPILFPLEGNVFPSPSSLPAIRKLNDFCGNSRSDKKRTLMPTWPSTGLLIQDKWGKGFLRPSTTCWTSKPCCTAGPRAPLSSLVPNFPSGTPTPKRGAWALPILIGNVEFSLSQRECGEGFVLELRSLLMLRTQEEGMSLGTAQSISKSCDGQTVTQKLYSVPRSGLEPEGGG